MRHLARAMCALLTVSVVFLGAQAPADAMSKTQKHKVATMAKKLKGTPYRYGGMSPRRGFDCSGYTKYVYGKTLHVGLGRTAGAQAKQGRAVPKGQKRRGDLIAFYNGRGVYHVGIYARDNIIWHASRPGQPVKAEKIWTSSYKVRRFR